MQTPWGRRAARSRRRARDGALLGWRTWMLMTDGTLMSPTQGTVWDGPALTADAWSDSAAVRGVAGIHACHLREDVPASPRSHIIGRVRGYGRYVLGTDGWRAERVVVDLLVVSPPLAGMVAALESRYQCRVLAARKEVLA